MKVNEELFNKITEATFVNIYTLSEQAKQDILLKDFNPLDKKHLFFLEVAKTSAGMFGYKVYIKMNFISFFFFKRRHKSTAIQRFKKTSKPLKEVVIDDVLNFMAQEFQRTSCVFERIYRVFYEGKGVEK